MAKLRSDEILAANPAALQCRCCQLYVDKGLIKHVNKLHDMSIADYKKNFGADAPVVSATTSKKLSDNIKGEKNVWSNHGGTLSRFSKKHAHYNGLSDSDKEIAITCFSKMRGYDPTKMTNRVEHYLAKGLVEAEARKEISKRQTTFSLEKCIEKLGPEAGLKRWQDRQEKWQNTLHSKPLEEQERINNAKMRKTGMISKAACSLFGAINQPGARWANEGGEVMIKSGRKAYMIDFVLDAKAIEFNGDFWHASPRIYEAYDVITFGPNRSYLAKEIWEKDAAKASVIRSCFDLLVIWEADYKKDPEGTVQKCKAFLAS